MASYALSLSIYFYNDLILDSDSSSEIILSFLASCSFMSETDSSSFSLPNMYFILFYLISISISVFSSCHFCFYELAYCKSVFVFSISVRTLLSFVFCIWISWSWSFLLCLSSFFSFSSSCMSKVWLSPPAFDLRSDSSIFYKLDWD